MIRSAMSLNAAVWPETYATASPPAVAFGTTSLRRRSTRLVGGLVLGRRGRRDEDDGDRLRVVELRLVDRRYTLDALDALVDPLRRLRVAADVDDDRDRAVEAWAEALGEEVVRAPARLLRRLCALIGCAEVDEC